MPMPEFQYFYYSKGTLYIQQYSACMKRYIYCQLIGLLLFTLPLMGQEKIPGTFQGKHHMLTADELEQQIFKNAAAVTSPPSGTVRNIAEFEPNEGVIITYMGWGFGLPIELMAEIAEEDKLVTLVSNASEVTEVLDIFLRNDVDTSNCEFIYASRDSYWCRDYSPWFIAVDNELALVDFAYNRPRYNDNAIPEVIAAAKNIERYAMDLVHTGGNWMCDGLGVAASTDLVMDENASLSKADVERIVNEYLGISIYHLLPDPQAEYIQHIDCWGKFLDVDKILIAKVDKNDSRYNDYEEMASYWAGQTSSYGTKYQVFRVYTPNDQPYTNSLILNNKVFVPVVAGFGSAYNSDALSVYRDAMPGYEVLGFLDNGFELWEPTDALHCRTHEIPESDMIYIRHIPLSGNYSNQESYEVAAEINSYANKSITSATLAYRYKGGSYQFMPMENTETNKYSALVENPISTTYDVVDYYIIAEDEEGKQAMHPFIGEADPHQFSFGDGTDIRSSIFLPAKISAYQSAQQQDVFISIKCESSMDLRVKMYDVHGGVIFSTAFETHAGNYIHAFDASEIKQGLYFLQVLDSEKNQIWIDKLLIK
jgi:agmatine deiminase